MNGKPTAGCRSLNAIGKSVERAERLSFRGDAGPPPSASARHLLVVELGDDGVDRRIDAVDPVEVRRHDLACRYLFALDQRREVSGTTKAEIVAALGGCRTHGLRLDVGRGASDRAEGGASARQFQERPSIRSSVHWCVVYCLS